MLLLPSMDLVEGMTRDPFAGGPYIMWGGTPLEHVMVPLEDKSE